MARTPLRKLLNDLDKPVKLPPPGTCARCFHPVAEHSTQSWQRWIGTYVRTVRAACQHDACACPYYLQPPKAQNARQRWRAPWNWWSQMHYGAWHAKRWNQKRRQQGRIQPYRRG